MLWSNYHDDWLLLSFSAAGVQPFPCAVPTITPLLRVTPSSCSSSLALLLGCWACLTTTTTARHIRPPTRATTAPIRSLRAGFATMASFVSGKGIVVDEFGEPSVLKVKDIQLRPPGAGEVLIKIEAAGVNPVDTYIRSGVYPAKPSLPYTPGQDGAGVVEAVGPSVNKLKVGDRVYVTKSVTGTYATHAIALAEKTHLLPPSVDFLKGAGLGVPAHTAHRGLFLKGRAVAGQDKVLIHGASGGVGLAAVQLAKSKGLYVVGTAGTPQGLELVKSKGADEVVNHREEGYEQRLLELSPSGFSVILEMLASTNLEKDLQLASQGGRVVIIGSRGTITINPRSIMGKELEVLGLMLYASTPSQEEEAAKDIYSVLASGGLDSVIQKTYRLSQAPEAHQEVIAHSDGSGGKLVLLPTQL